MIWTLFYRKVFSTDVQLPAPSLKKIPGSEHFFTGKTYIAEQSDSGDDTKSSKDAGMFVVLEINFTWLVSGDMLVGGNVLWDVLDDGDGEFCCKAAFNLCMEW